MARLTRRIGRNPDGQLRPPRYREFVVKAVKKAVVWALKKVADNISSFIVGVLTIWTTHLFPWAANALAWLSDTVAWIHSALDCLVGC